MANLTESATFDAGVYQLEITDPVVGGASGVANTPLKNLANRTKYLKAHVDAIEAGTTIPATIAPINSPALTGNPTAPTAASGDSSFSLATTAFVNAVIAGVLTKSVAGGANVALTAVESGNGIISLTGLLTANIQVVVPTTMTDRWIFDNETTGPFSITVKGATGAGVVITQGLAQEVIWDGVDVIVISSAISGAVLASAINAALNKATPVGADQFGIWDSVTGTLNHLTWANLVATFWNTLATLTLQGDQFKISNDPSIYREGTCSATSGDLYTLLGANAAALTMKFRSHGFAISAGGVFQAADETGGLMLDVYSEGNLWKIFYYAGGTIGVAPTVANFGTPVWSLDVTAGNSVQIGTASIAAGTLPGHAVRFDQVFGQSNNVGVAGSAGFGVGICPALPAGFIPMMGYTQPNSDNYGNYQYVDGSIMVWIPAFYYRIGNAADPGYATYGVNTVNVQPESAFANVAAANAAGYALHRMFYDAGAVQRGAFVDKYKCSINGNIASSIKNGIPCSSNAANAPFSACTANGQAPAQFYYGAIAAAKSRGNNFFPGSVFINKALAMLSYAHAQAATSAAWCAWYDATGAMNFPRGCNNNALGDQNDLSLLFATSGYSTANRTGSANMLAKTTHNGQNCGVVDVNGTMWEVALGITSDSGTGVNFYVLKTSATMKLITAGNTLATDAWGAAGIAALYDSLGATYGALTNSSTAKVLGAATQVFSAALTGNAWNATGAGIPLVTGTGGTNPYGNDGIWDYRPADMCPIVSGGWDDAASAGVGALYPGNGRSTSISNVGLRAALYL